MTDSAPSPQPATKAAELQNKPNLLGLPRAELEQFFVDWDEKPFRARQIMKWLHQRGADHFDDMTDISKVLRERLQAATDIVLPEMVTQQISDDGTRKWALRMGQGQAIETVYIPEGKRGTLCVSSQVGCALDCSFCSTATAGFNRNLSTAEIVGQLRYANNELGLTPEGQSRVTNVVFMGMGEPLANYDAVVRAIQIMLDDFGYGLSKRKVTVSTSGIVPQIDRLKASVDVALAVSLHAPNDALRDELVPINRKYNINRLLQACRDYTRDKDRKASITYEYVMLDGVNDSPENARQLAKLLRNLPAKVNLIPFNPFPGTIYKRSPDDVIEHFARILLAAGVRTTVRRTRGDDIDAACGQLVGKVNSRNRGRINRGSKMAKTQLKGIPVVEAQS